MTKPTKHRQYILILLVFAVNQLSAQIIPNGQQFPGSTTQTLNPIPSAYPTATALNFIRTWEAEKPITVDSLLSSSSRTVQEVKQTTRYFDGLGRPLQDVVKGISPSGFDMVSTFLYDSVGREQFRYLPYISTSNNGNFKTNPFSEQSSFMSGFYNPSNSSNGERYYYGRTDYEASPLNRIVNKYAPGNSWVGTATGVNSQYAVNLTSDSVVIWKVSTDTTGLTPRAFGYYGYGKLFKNITTDENGNKLIEYKDNEGQLILKKVQLWASPASGHSGWLCTYYIYDDAHNLRYVIQPMGVELLMPLNWTFESTAYVSSSIAKEQTFSYEYDLRNRMTIKRVPGAGPVWMVYDARDRLVMSQDSALRFQGVWLYTQFDSLNRPVLTGKWTTTGDLYFHQLQAGGVINYPSPSSNFTILSQTYYDDYSWVAGSGSGLSSTQIKTYNSNTNYFYNPDNNSFPYPQSMDATTLTRGMVTGVKRNVVNSTNFLYSVSFYDDRRRLVETQSTNITGGKDTTIVQYGFTGRVLRTLVAHGKSGTNNLAYLVLTKQFYDASGRMTAITKKVGNSFEDSIAISKYNELGQLAFKKIGQTRTSLTNFAYTANPIDSLIYSYNIRGWLSGINKSYAVANYSAGWFGFEVDYDFGFTQSQFNGNISGLKWRNKNDGEQRAYGFSYDPVNRLTRADFTQYTASAWNTSAGVDFTTRNLSYDANGNIKTMSQMGLKLNTSSLVDSLLYNYNTNSNRLNYVTDRANDTSARLGDFTERINSNTQDYSYDGNGRMTVDSNKNITSIRYNHLNLPDSIVVAGKGYIKYLYDASGVKQQKITVDNVANKKTVTTYVGAFVYQYTAIPSTGTGADTLQMILQEEGRIRPKTVAKSDTMFYDFFEKDHLGNIRVVLTDEKRLDIYPAATVENKDSSINMLKNQYYTINLADTVGTARIASWGSTSGNNYQNNNGNPPYNTDPYVNVTATSAVVYKLNGNTGDRTGLGITLKVMAGDTVNVYGKSFWHNSTGSNPVNNYLITSILSSFISAFAGTPAIVGSGKGATSTALNGSSVTSSGLNTWLGGVPNPGLASVPKAYINWILFDEQFRPISSSSGFDLVSTSPDVVKSHQQTIQISKGGYLYVYCSNESNLDVYFDNLQLIHTRGPLLETNDYYPFGVAMNGVCSKAAVNQLNIYKFNGNELENNEFIDGSGLEWYDYGMRNYNMQIGRWDVIDPLVDKMRRWSPYNYAFDNPARFTDEFGMSPEDIGDNNQIAGYYYDPKTGEVYFDPNVHGQDDLGKDSKYVYLGERISVTGSDGTTTWYDENGSASKTDPHWGELPLISVNSNSKGKARENPAGKILEASFLSAGVLAADDVTVVGIADDPGIPVVMGVGAVSAGIVWIGYEIYDAVQPEDEVEPYFYLPEVPPAVVLSAKTLNDLVPGSLKRQKSWDDGYAEKTPEEIERLAKGGDKVAKTMKKIYEQSKRLLEKQNQKHK